MGDTITNNALEKGNIMAEHHQCLKEAEIAKQGARVENIENALKDMNIKIGKIFDKLDKQPSWQFVSVLTFLIGVAVTVIVGFMTIQ